VLKGIGLGIAAAILFLVSPFLEAYGQYEIDLTNIQNGTTVTIVGEQEPLFKWNDIAVIIGSVLAAIATAIFTPIIREKFKIREEYLLPYRRWCISFSGMLHEFEELCKYVRCGEDVTDVDVIVHTWAMHQELETGFRWLNVLRNEGNRAKNVNDEDGDPKEVGDILDELMDAVDELWHRLQTDHKELLDKQTTTDDIYAIIQYMDMITPGKTSIIAEKIKTAIRIGDANGKSPFDKENFIAISTTLKKKIPRKYLWLFQN
jgi:hypothetical protein